MSDAKNVSSEVITMEKRKTMSHCCAPYRIPFCKGVIVLETKCA